MIDDIKVFYAPGDIVKLRHESIENRPTMLVKEKDIKIIRNELRDAQDMNKESSQALPKAAMEALLGIKKD